MTIVDTGLSRPDRDRLIAVRADPGQAWRTEPYERKLQYALRHGAALPPRASEAKVDTALERIFTEPDFLHSRWLADGAKRCDAVARLVTPVEMGTGFLASPWLLVTNNHVLPDAATAADTEVTFRDRGGRPRPHHPRGEGPPRPGPLLPHQPDRRAGLHRRRRGGRQGQAAGQGVRLHPHGGRHRQDPQRAPGEHRPASRRPRPGDRGPQQPPGRGGRRPLPDVRDRHRARLVRITGAQRRVGARRAAQPRRAGTRRAGPARRRRRPGHHRRHARVAAHLGGEQGHPHLGDRRRPHGAPGGRLRRRRRRADRRAAPHTGGNR